MTFTSPWGSPGIPESHCQYMQYFPNFTDSTNHLIHVRPSYQKMSRRMRRARKNKFPIRLPDDRGLPPKPQRNNDFGIGRSLEGKYMIVNNIPKDFRSTDLRSFFSKFIETSGFVCFHFIHRPEIQVPTTAEQSPENYQSKCNTTCCVIKVDTKRASEFIESYNGEHWVDKNGLARMTQCFIKNIIIDPARASHEASEPQKKKRISYKIHANCDRFEYKNVKRFGEMHPPSYMPHGNVGTKNSHFQEENHAHRLPPKVVRKLGLKFHGPEGNNHHQEQDLAEERDNNNALHNDVIGQDGTKGKLFEGVTDREKCFRNNVLCKHSDDLGCINGNFGTKINRTDCDKGAENLLEIQVNETVRYGAETEVDHLHEFAAFDKYGNGFGRKLMESLGWKEGQGIGKDCSGISEPLMGDGQKPTNRKGLGYHDKKLERKYHPKKIQKDSAKSEIPFSGSTIVNPQAAGSRGSDFTYTSNFKAKYKGEFIKEQEDISSK